MAPQGVNIYVDRRIGGLENGDTEAMESDKVDRRIGGLEMCQVVL